MQIKQIFILIGVFMTSLSAFSSAQATQKKPTLEQSQTQTQRTIYKVNSLQDINEKLDELSLDPQTTIIGSNLHNTLITYKDPLLRAGVNKLVNDLVAKKVANEIARNLEPKEAKNQLLKQYKEKYMSIVLLNADYQLTEQTKLYTSASFIQELADKFFVIGYSNSKTGSFGEIENMEEWKTNLLKQYGLAFKPLTKKSIKFANESVKQNYPIYNDGILFVGNKTDRARAFVDLVEHIGFQLKQLVIIDNKEENIEQLQEELKEYGISVLGFVYNYQNKSPIDEEFAERQKETLLNEGVWLNQ